ncbi:5'-3' exoribonuclease 2 [Striga asiatica]|uniref:5'-3' exoribonuclease 2 n=1 Tax=Striga asiatica TaxID=4170 RepID=A0A5A7RK79_STRAF|nr:5'-3' exoribonuclease 2 [Striga asiatica]
MSSIWRRKKETSQKRVAGEKKRRHDPPPPSRHAASRHPLPTNSPPPPSFVDALFYTVPFLLSLWTSSKSASRTTPLPSVITSRRFSSAAANKAHFSSWGFYVGLNRIIRTTTTNPSVATPTEELGIPIDCTPARFRLSSDSHSTSFGYQRFAVRHPAAKTVFYPIFYLLMVDVQLHEFPVGSLLEIQYSKTNSWLQIKEMSLWEFQLLCVFIAQLEQTQPESQVCTPLVCGVLFPVDWM